MKKKQLGKSFIKNEMKIVKTGKRSFFAMFVIWVLMVHISQGALIPCGNMNLSPSSVPLANYSSVNILAAGTVTYGSLSDPISDVRIVPMVRLNPANNAACGTDYYADLSSGTATLHFIAIGPYFVRITHANSLVEEQEIRVGMRDDLQAVVGCPTGVAKEFNCGTQTVAIVSTGASDYASAFSPTGILVGGLQAAIDSICNKYIANGSKPISVALVGHGSSGEIVIGGDTLKAGAQLDSFISKLKGKIDTLVLFSCSAASGQAGRDLVCALKLGLGSDVVGFTGKVDGQGNPPNVVWSTAGEAYRWQFPWWHFSIDFLPPQGKYISLTNNPTKYLNTPVRIRNICHFGFSNQAPPPPLNGMQFYSFPSNVVFDVSLNNGQSYNQMQAPANCLVKVTSTGIIGNVRTFQTEMNLLTIQGGTLPPGVMIRESPTLPSYGGLSIAPGSGGGFNFNSYFDIYTEVSFDGGQTYAPSVGNTEVYLTLPNSAAVPTLSQWGLISLTGLLLFSGFMLLFKRNTA